MVSRRSLNNPAVPAESITVAYSPFESTALLWIAEDQHYFEKNGLNLTLRKYDSGAGSLDGVINGEADLAVGVTEFPLVRQSVPGRKSPGDREYRQGLIYLYCCAERPGDRECFRSQGQAGRYYFWHSGRIPSRQVPYASRA